FDVPVYEPAFASFFVAIQRPRLDFKHVKKRPTINVDAARKGIEDANRSFLESVEVITHAAESGSISKKMGTEHRSALEAVALLLPGGDSPFDTVEIQGLRGSTSSSSKISAEASHRIREAYHISLLSKRTVEGRVVEVSERSSSFIVRTGTYREITCVAKTE